MNHNTENAYRKVASILEEIASRFEKESEQEGAIKKAAWALGYIFISNQWEQLDDFIAKNGTPATQEQIDRMHEHLRTMGIDPNCP